MWKEYNDSPVRDLITNIPLYRKYFIEHNDQKFNSSVEFYKSFVFNQLENDKEKIWWSWKNPKTDERKSKINSEHLAKKITKGNYVTNYFVNQN